MAPGNGATRRGGTRRAGRAVKHRVHSVYRPRIFVTKPKTSEPEHVSQILRRVFEDLERRLTR